MAVKIEHENAEAIRESFNSCNLEVEESAISTCISICTEFQLTADNLAAQWDAYAMNNQLTGAADVEKLTMFRSKIAQKKIVGAKSNAHTASSTNLVGQKRNYAKVSSTTPVIKREIKTESQDLIDSLYNLKSPDAKPHTRNGRAAAAAAFASPTAKVQRTSSSMFSPTTLQSPPAGSYENREDAGKTVTEFNAHLKKNIEMTQWTTQLDDKVIVTTPFSDRNLKSNTSYMYTPLFERAIALDEQLTEYEELVKAHYKLEELMPVGDPSPAMVTVVGRIVCEAAEGKLNPSVVQLEGSRKSCGGQRILLDVSGVPNLQLFAGKIVAVEGVFADTRSPMVVKRFLEPIPAPMPKLESIHGEADSRPLRVVTACGPFTTTNNISYLPLQDLLQVVSKETPDVLILVGPFIDSTHGSFQDGLVEYDGMMVGFEDIFLFKVMATLDRVLEQHQGLHIVMVPSIRDAHHSFVYPQPPFNKKKACEALGSPDTAKRVHMMSNPCTFAINNVVFGVSALDIVMHLSSSELYRSQTRDQNRLMRLCQQVVDQRSYYPLFPPPPNTDVPLDLRYMAQFQFEKTPDVLILPSMLNRFCGRVHDSICINPGQLCRGESGGTFAAMTILPLSPDKTNELLVERTAATIKRI